MNTKNFKRINIILGFSIMICLGLFYFTTNQKNSRTVATDDGADAHLTEQQKLKKSVAQQFSFEVNSSTFKIAIPHIADLCLENTTIRFVFKALEIAYAGQSPTINYTLSCSQQSELNQFQFELWLTDFKELQSIKSKNLQQGQLSSTLLYSDEPYPEKWILSEIQIQGNSSFEINEFEINETFKNNFEFVIK